MSRTQPVINSRRTLSLSLTRQSRTVKGFTIDQWEIASLSPGSQGPHVLELQLYMTERAAYRFNLNGDSPQLFVCGGMTGEPPVPSAITASQEVAAAWMDGERQVLDTNMPLAIQAWIEAYLAHHGEAPVEGRKKKGKPHPQPEEKQ